MRLARFMSLPALSATTGARRRPMTCDLRKAGLQGATRPLTASSRQRQDASQPGGAGSDNASPPEPAPSENEGEKIAHIARHKTFHGHD
jgi:hypothetical protein